MFSFDQSYSTVAELWHFLAGGRGGGHQQNYYASDWRPEVVRPVAGCCMVSPGWRLRKLTTALRLARDPLITECWSVRESIFLFFFLFSVFFFFFLFSFFLLPALSFD